jgi:long-chain acyl-CoA synthetase
MTRDLRHRAQCSPARIAIEVGLNALRYGELDAQANQLARVFARLGLERGDHVAGMLSSSSPFPLVIAWAAWRSGVYYTPVSTALSETDAAHIIGDCSAKLVIADGRYAVPAAELRRRLPGQPLWLSHGPPIAGFESIEGAMLQHSKQPREDESPGALMLYTSGTTDVPKAVWRPLPDASWRGAPPFAADLIAEFRLDENVRYLSTAPLYHAASLRFALAVTAAGGSVHALEEFEPEAALHALGAWQITHSQWVPAMFERLLRLPLELRQDFSAPHHAVALHAAATCPVPIKQAMIEWWGPILLEYYSGTEGVGLTKIDSHDWLQRPGSVGRATKGVSHVVDAAGHDVPAGQVGEVYFAGNPPFQYFRDADRTARRTHRLGWQTLGDIGYLDAGGYLYLTGRVEDVIISCGIDISPREIEATILELPEVEDCGVVGVSDEALGQRPVAFVVPRPGIAADEVVRRVQEHCLRRLGRIKQPERYVRLEALPRSSTGKLLRRSLRAYLDAPATRTRPDFGSMSPECLG